MIGDYELDFDWRGFELHPDTPPGGIDVAAKYGAARVASMRTYMTDFARSFGVEMGSPSRSPNTRAPLAVAEYARSVGRLHPWRNAAMDGHWTGGLDIEDDAAIAALAEQAGLDPAAAVAAAADPRWQAKVDELGAEARAWGVTGIPTFFLIPDGWTPEGAAADRDMQRPVRVVGCQPYETLVRAADMIEAPRRTQA